MTGTFRAGHNKPRPRLRGPLHLNGERRGIGKKGALAAIATVGILLAAGFAIKSNAHPGAQTHQHIYKSPLAGVRNNYWYDYRSDVEEAENELRKDLRRAKSAQDRREAWQEYNRELRDARSDYRKEMVEKGYIRRGEVIVGG
jgi:hypothetical protein